MAEVSTIGLDLAKQVFHAHGADASGRPVFSRRITRAKLIPFFASQPKCTVAMETCGGKRTLAVTPQIAASTAAWGMR